MRLTSGETLADLLTASMAAGRCSPHAFSTLAGTVNEFTELAHLKMIAITFGPIVLVVCTLKNLGYMLDIVLNRVSPLCIR